MLLKQPLTFSASFRIGIKIETLPKALFGEFLITRIVNELKITKASASAERYTEISINY
jgi:hypothetical protein